MKNLLLISLALIAIGLGYLKWQGSKQITILPSPLPTVVASPVPENIDTSSWLTYTNDSFSLLYPPVASISAVSTGIDAREWRVTYMGDIQQASGRTQTELWDGYAVSVTRFEGVEADPQVQAEVDRQGTIGACGEESVTPIVKSQLGQNIEALKYHGGCLGEADLYYLAHDNILYRVTNLVAKPSGQTMDYDAITTKILSTISFQ